MPGVRVKMASLVKYAGERDTGSPKPPPTKARGVSREDAPGGETLRVFLSAHASGFQTGRLGVTPAVETAYVTSAGMDAGAQAHPSE
jgi:hypothetical protein